MKRYNTILESTLEPEDKNVLWMYKNKLKKFSNNGWENVDTSEEPKVNEDDLSIRDSKIEFSSREPNHSKFTMIGYNIIRKNIVNGENILNQEMLLEENTIYEIKYDFNLDGGKITIPKNSSLKFNGGTIKNGVINLNGGNIDSDYYCFQNVKIYTLNSLELNIKWFGFSEDNSPEGNASILKFIIDEISPLQNKKIIIYIPSGTYTMRGVSSNVSSYISLIGDGQYKTILHLDSQDRDSLFLLELDSAYSYFSDISFQGNTFNWDKGKVWSNPNKNLIALFKLSGYSNIIERCSFRGSSNHGVFLTGVNHITFNDCSFLYNLGYGAFNIFVRGVIYNNPWCELNYMGGIIHTVPYQNNNYSSDNIVKVNGGICENLGIYGIKGNVKNYKGENFEYQSAFVCLDNTSNDLIDFRLSYSTNSDYQGLVIKPSKRKKCTLEEDTVLEFVDNQWNDFIVYERGGVFNLTFDKSFKAGDTIYLYDYQQDLTNPLNWEEEVFQLSNTLAVNNIIIGGAKSYLTIDKSLIKNYDIIGTPYKVNNLLTDCTVGHYRYSGYNMCNYISTSKSSDVEIQNPIINGIPVYYGNIYNPIISISSIDKSDVYLYICGYLIGNARLTIFNRTNNELSTLHTEVLSLTGDFCIEYHLGDANDITQIQINLTAAGSSNLMGYALIASEGRGPIIRDVKTSGNFASKPDNPIIGFSYFCTDKKSIEGDTNGIIIYYKGNNTWVDALGRIIE